MKVRCIQRCQSVFRANQYKCAAAALHKYWGCRSSTLRAAGSQHPTGIVDNLNAAIFQRDHYAARIEVKRSRRTDNPSRELCLRNQLAARTDDVEFLQRVIDDKNLSIDREGTRGNSR